jgi:hypothetical protein
METLKLTEEIFTQYLHTKFLVQLGEQPVELELAEVKTYRSEYAEEQGMERFSIYFDGPVELMLAQGMYSMHHEQMGSFDIFIVPLAARETNARYEAVFNYYK